MKRKSPAIEEWEKLYKAIIKVKEIAPWEWMYEDDIFAVQNPETDEPGFVSVMGTLGEHYAISVYLGEKGLYGFWDLHESTPEISRQMIFEIPQLQASFEDRDFLHPKDRNLMKQLGLKFKGRQSWPLFRSYRPGFFPWYLESDEVRFLHYVLEQLVDVSLRFKKDRSLLSPIDDDQYLLRIPIKKEDRLVWQDSTLAIVEPEPFYIELSVNMFGIHALKGIATSNLTIEIDLFMVMSPVRDKNQRPYYPYVLMIVDAQSELIIGNELLSPLPNLEAMWVTIPLKIVECLTKIQLLPQKILVCSDLMYNLLLELTDELNVLLEQSEDLPNLDPIRESIMEQIE